MKLTSILFYPRRVFARGSKSVNHDFCNENIIMMRSAFELRLSTALLVLLISLLYFRDTICLLNMIKTQNLIIEGFVSVVVCAAELVNVFLEYKIMYIISL